MIEKFASIEKAVDYLCSYVPSCDTYYDPLETKALKVALPIVGALVLVAGGKLIYRYVTSADRALAKAQRELDVLKKDPLFATTPKAKKVEEKVQITHPTQVSLDPQTLIPYEGAALQALTVAKKLLKENVAKLIPSKTNPVPDTYIDPSKWSVTKMGCPPSNHAIVYLTMLWKNAHIDFNSAVMGHAPKQELLRLATEYMQVSFILSSFALDDHHKFTAFLNNKLKPTAPISPGDLLSDKYKEYYPRNLSLVLPEAYRQLKKLYPLEENKFYQNNTEQRHWNGLYHLYIERRSKIIPGCVDPILNPDTQKEPFWPKSVYEIENLLRPHLLFHGE